MWRQGFRISDRRKNLGSRWNLQAGYIIYIYVHVHVWCKDKPIVTVLDVKMGEQDLVDAVNYEAMKSYVPALLTGVQLPNPDLIDAKEHHVRAQATIHDT